MVGIAQLVERLVVVQDVAGSSPVTHPKWVRFELLTKRPPLVFPHQSAFLTWYAMVIALPELGLERSMTASEWCAMVIPALRDDVPATG